VVVGARRPHNRRDSSQPALTVITTSFRRRTDKGAPVLDNQVSFHLNGKLITINDPAPDLLLIDYLRSPEVGLAGAKKACGQGGCGACTVIVSSWTNGAAEHRAINSCLRPVCALGGLVVTTVEGTGAVRKPDPLFLQHTHTASRAAAPIGMQDSHVFTKATEAAKNKRTSVLQAVRDKRARKQSHAVKLVETVADCPSEHSHEGMNPSPQPCLKGAAAPIGSSLRWSSPERERAI